MEAVVGAEVQPLPLGHHLQRLVLVGKAPKVAEQVELPNRPLLLPLSPCQNPLLEAEDLKLSVLLVLELWEQREKVEQLELRRLSQPPPFLQR